MDPRILFQAEGDVVAALGHDNVLLAAFDEVGRGCLAGPVVAGCTLWRATSASQASSQANSSETRNALLARVDDSKALSERVRLEVARQALTLFPFEAPAPLRWALEDVGIHSTSPSSLFVPEVPHLEANGLVASRARPLDYDDLASARTRTTLARSVKRPRTSKRTFHCVGMGLGQACNLEIDTHNIWRCVQVAMARALNAALTARFSDSRGLEGIDRAYRGDKEGAETETLVLVVDGNRAIAVAEEHADATQVTCVRGDSRFVSLGLASVVAKVARDADMVRAGRLHPGYGFERHKGYGTAEHLVALRERAPMSLHRRTFLKSFV